MDFIIGKRQSSQQREQLIARRCEEMLAVINPYVPTMTIREKVGNPERSPNEQALYRLEKQGKIKRKKIGTRIYYYQPQYEQKFYEDLGLNHEGGRQ